MQRRDVSDQAADREVARALRARGGSATVADVVVDTALPEQTAERALARLLEACEGSVGVAKGGALIYRFTVGPLGLKPRRERRALLRAAVRAAAAVTSGAVAGGRAAFRAVLALQLLTYLMAILAPVSVVIGVVVGIVLFVVMVVMALSDGDLSGVFDLLTNPYIAGLLLLGCVVYASYRVFKKNYDILLALAGKHEGGRRGVAGFIGQVNDFALGPEKPPTRAERIGRAWAVSQEDEKVVLARVRAQGGRLRAGDLVAWLGLGLDEADRQATRICVEYDGEPAAADIDVVEFELARLQETAGGAGEDGGKTRHERGVQIPRLTANAFKEDAVIAGFAVANGAAGAVGWSLMHARGPGWWHAATIAGGFLPMAFSAVLLGLPLLRAPGFMVRRALRRRARRRARIHDAIVAHCRARHDAPLDLEAVGVPAETRPAALALAGTFDLDGADPPKTVWRFPRLARELGARREAGAALREVKELVEE